MRLLLVEDDPAIAEPLVEALGREGFAVTWAPTGSDALAAEPVDLVLLDLGLPDLDGREVCRRLQAARPVPVIVLTARDDELEREVEDLAGRRARVQQRVEGGGDDVSGPPRSARIGARSQENGHTRSVMDDPSNLSHDPADRIFRTPIKSVFRDERCQLFDGVHEDLVAGGGEPVNVLSAAGGNPEQGNTHRHLHPHVAFCR